MKVDSKGEYSSQGESLQVLFGVCVEQRTGTEAQIGHRHHLKNNISVAISNCSEMSAVTSKACAVANSYRVAITIPVRANSQWAEKKKEKGSVRHTTGSYY